MTDLMPARAEAQKIWQEGFDFRCCTTKFEVKDEYIFHSHGVAQAAENIAAQIPAMDSEKAYVLGLLHDYGKNMTNGKPENSMRAQDTKNLKLWDTMRQPKFV